MTYSLGSATKPNATWGTYYNALGDVQSERFRKIASLTPDPLIGMDSDETIVDDEGGAILRITLDTAKTFTSFANAVSFVQALLTLINGEQYVPNYPLTYVSDVLGTIYVKVEDIDTPVIVGDGPCVVRYTLHLIQCSNIW